jgi:hypothetical protein
VTCVGPTLSGVMCQSFKKTFRPRNKRLGESDEGKFTLLFVEVAKFILNGYMLIC